MIVVVRQGQPCHHGGLVLLNPGDQARQLRDAAAFHVFAPGVELFCGACPQQVRKLLDQLRGLLDCGVQPAKPSQGLLFVRFQFFPAAPQQKHRLPDADRRTRKRLASLVVFPSLWKQTDQLLRDGPRGVAVATGDEFPIQLTYSVAARCPAGAQRGQGCLQFQRGRTRGLLRKAPRCEPEGDPALADAHSVSTGRLPEALVAQPQHWLVASQALSRLAWVIAACMGLRLGGRMLYAAEREVAPDFCAPRRR